jgi:hypothetical protein
MTSAASSIPDSNALICEHCGYNLSGLAGSSACPECGTRIAESSPDLRHLSDWEQRGGVCGFIATSLAVLLHPSRFFRSLATRQPLEKARTFAWIHWSIVSLIFAATAFRHNSIGATTWWTQLFSGSPMFMQPMFYALVAATFLAIAGTTQLAVLLTAWEAAYRGLRLPYHAARRAMYFHAAHYMPVAVVAMATVYVFAWLFNAQLLGPTAVMRYIYILAAEIIAGAGYLFKTYWIGMRNIMYANA